MLNILADALMIAAGQLNHTGRHQHLTEGEWNDRFISARMRGLDEQARRFSTRRDLNW